MRTSSSARMCRTLSALIVQVFLRVALASSLQVKVEVPSPTSTFGCFSDAAKVIFQTVVGRHSDGTKVVFEREWISNLNAELVLQRMPDPFGVSNIVKCANAITEAGYSSFEFSNGSCTAVELINPFCCEDTSGLHIYISEQFDVTSLDMKPFIDNSGGIIHKLLPVLINLSQIPGVMSTIEYEAETVPAYLDAVVTGVDDNVYDVPLQFFDLVNCLSDSPCGPVVSYNRTSLLNASNVYYLYDYCGGSIPGLIDLDAVIFSHRGFGCKYMPSQLEDEECTVQFTTTDIYQGSVVPFFPDQTYEPSCEGLVVTVDRTTPSGVETKKLCDEYSNRLFYLSSSTNYTVAMASTKWNRLGFVLGPIFSWAG